MIEDVLEEWGKISGLQRENTTIAVLVRTHKEAEEVSQWLLEKGIPVVTESSLKLNTSFVVKGLMNLMKYFVDRENLLALYGFLASGLWKRLKEEVLAEVWEKDIGRLRLEVDTFIEQVFSSSAQSTPYEILWRFIEALGLWERLEKDLVAHRSFVERLLELAHIYEIEQGLMSPDS